MSLYAVSESCESFDVRLYDSPTLRNEVYQGRAIYWYYDGLVSKIPNAVLRDALRVVDDFDKQKKRHPELGVPLDAGMINWEQTVKPKSTSVDGPSLRLLPQRP